jgi:hypothetical protein
VKNTPIVLESNDPAGLELDAIRTIRDDIARRVRELLVSLGIQVG